jgi:hypothetical protein
MKTSSGIGPVEPVDLGPPIGSPSSESTVVGEADTALGAGVYGNNKQGVGVWGVSEGGEAGVYGSGAGADGIGIRGQGRHFAGLFEGDVEITGALTVQNQNILPLIESGLAREASLRVQEIWVDSGGATDPEGTVSSFSGTVNLDKEAPVAVAQVTLTRSAYFDTPGWNQVYITGFTSNGIPVPVTDFPVFLAVENADSFSYRGDAFNGAITASMTVFVFG